MKFKNLIKTLTVTVLAITVVLALTGCGDTKATLEYVTKLKEVSTAAQTANTEFMTELGSIDPADEASKQALVAAVTKIEDAYKQFAELKAPKKLQDVQSSFKAGSEKGLEGLAIYKEAFQNMSADSDMQELLDELQKGDDVMVDAQALIQEGLDKADKLSK